MKHRKLSIALFLVTSILSACASVGVPTPQTFNERLATGYVTVTTIRQVGTTLVTSGKLSPGDAQNVQNQADTARAGLDIARSLRATVPDAAAAKLEATLVILQELQKYVNSKQKESK